MRNSSKIRGRGGGTTKRALEANRRGFVEIAVYPEVCRSSAISLRRTKERKEREGEGAPGGIHDKERDVREKKTRETDRLGSR